MKKLDRRRETLNSIQQMRASYVRGRRIRYLHLRRGGVVLDGSSKQAKEVDSPQSSLKKIPVPKVLSLNGNQKETLEFLSYAASSNKRNRANRRAGSLRPTSYFDFVGLQTISPAAALVLCSVYDIFQRRGGDFKVFDYEQWSPDVRDTFAQVGFFKWLDFKGLPSTDSYSGELSIQAFESERLHDPEKPVVYLQKLVSAFNSSRESERESTMGEAVSRRVASSILEAVENSVRHAYHHGVPKDIRGRWWVGGVSRPQSGEVLVACYDCGVSIPGSIESGDTTDDKGVRRYVRRVLQRFLSASQMEEAENELDHKRLKVALNYLYTTSGVKGGGKGLAHIASTIDECEDGSVEIFTRRAYFCAKKGEPERFALLPSAMPGTLIIWRMRLYAQS